MNIWKRRARDLTGNSPMRLPVTPAAMGRAANAFAEDHGGRGLYDHNFTHPLRRDFVISTLRTLEDTATPVIKRAVGALNRAYSRMCDEHDASLR